MYIVKPIEVSFTLTCQQCYLHPESHNDLVKFMFNEQYKNKCIARCYVIDVVDVVRVSPLYMIESDLEGRGLIHAILMVECIIYEPNMIIPNATLIAKNNGVLSFESDFARITVSEITDKSSIKGLLQIGNIVPIEVSHTCYDTCYDKNINKVISCTGSIYNPSSYSNNTIIRVKDLSENDVKYLKEITEYQQNKLDNVDKKLLAKLQNNMYKYKKPPKTSKLFSNFKIKITKTHKLLDFDKFPTYNGKKTEVFVSRPDIIPRHEPLYMELDIPKNELELILTPSPSMTVVDMNAKDFIEYCIMDYFMMTAALVDMTKTYSQNKLYDKNSVLWKYYDSVKI